MTDFFLLSLVSALFVYPCAFTMAEMHGPFGFCGWFREWVCGKCMEGNCETCRYEWITEGIHCPVCWSFWMCILAFLTVGKAAMPAWGLCLMFHLWAKKGE